MAGVARYEEPVPMSAPTTEAEQPASDLGGKLKPAQSTDSSLLRRREGATSSAEGSGSNEEIFEKQPRRASRQNTSTSSRRHQPFNLKRSVTELFTPDRKVGKDPTYKARFLSRKFRCKGRALMRSSSGSNLSLRSSRRLGSTCCSYVFRYRSLCTSPKCTYSTYSRNFMMRAFAQIRSGSLLGLLCSHHTSG